MTRSRPQRRPSGGGCSSSCPERGVRADCGTAPSTRSCLGRCCAGRPRPTRGCWSSDAPVVRTRGRGDGGTSSTRAPVSKTCAPADTTAWPTCWTYRSTTAPATRSTGRCTSSARMLGTIRAALSAAGRWPPRSPLCGPRSGSAATSAATGSRLTWWRCRQGLYYGHVRPSEVGQFVATHEAGRLLVSRYRGRSSLSAPEQTAQDAARLRTGLDGIDDGPVLSCTPDTAGGWTVVIDGPHGPLRYTVSAERRELDHPLTCHAQHNGTVTMLTARQMGPTW